MRRDRAEKKKQPNRTENRDQSTDPSRDQVGPKVGTKAKPTVKTASTAVCFFTVAYVLDWIGLDDDGM